MCGFSCVAFLSPYIFIVLNIVPECNYYCFMASIYIFVITFLRSLSFCCFPNLWVCSPNSCCGMSDNACWYFSGLSPSHFEVWRAVPEYASRSRSNQQQVERKDHLSGLKRSTPVNTQLAFTTARCC